MRDEPWRPSTRAFHFSQLKRRDCCTLCGLVRVVAPFVLVLVCGDMWSLQDPLTWAAGPPSGCIPALVTDMDMLHLNCSQQVLYHRIGCVLGPFLHKVLSQGRE